MKTSTLIVILVIALGNSGCAYLTTYKRDIDLKDGSVAIDVKQRVVFSQKVKNKDGEQTIVCAEPSPDALTVLGASGSLSLNTLDKAANASAGLAESGAFVGLRTQSIQLLRDAMYRLCEGYAGGAVTPSDYAAMQRRYQSTMMGLIAIEQLTGPVIAGQALLTSAASGQGGASAGDAAVDKAQQGASTAAEAKLKAQADLDKAIARDQAAKAQVSSLQKQLSAERAKDKPDDAAINDTVGKQPAADQEAIDARLALADARRRADAADGDSKRAQADLLTARGRASASASGSGALSDVARASEVSTQHLTHGVVKIVSEINRSYTKDTCITLLVELSKPESVSARAGKSAEGNKFSVALDQSLDVCTRILAEAAKEPKPKPKQDDEE